VPWFAIPPPSVAEPPVMPTPVILTVTPEATVTTGPPPLMMVLVGPAPASVRPFEIVMPPLYVPAAMEIVSPGLAAATAGATWL